jgi:hypothetical protein
MGCAPGRNFVPSQCPARVPCRPTVSQCRPIPISSQLVPGYPARSSGVSPPQQRLDPGRGDPNAENPATAIRTNVVAKNLHATGPSGLRRALLAHVIGLPDGSVDNRLPSISSATRAILAYVSAVRRSVSLVRSPAADNARPFTGFARTSPPTPSACRLDREADPCLHPARGSRLCVRRWLRR